MSPRRAALPRTLTLLVALLLGWAAHGWHHIADPACDAGGGAGHACTTCSALHGGALGTATVVAAAPVRLVVRAPYRTAATRIAARETRRPGAPRAPPAA